MTTKKSYGIFREYRPPIIKLPKYEPPKIKLGLAKGKDYTRGHLTPNEKWIVLKRQGFKCKGNCKPKVDFRKIRPHFDHITPVNRGGGKGRNLKNIQALCPNCHDTKSRAEKKKGRKPKSIWNVPSSKNPIKRI